MPLNMSRTQEAVSENIRTEIAHGRKPKQAKAIAMGTFAKAWGLSPAMQRKARRENWSVKRIIAVGKWKSNPYPLLIATLANPAANKGLLQRGVNMHSESHGNVTIKPRQMNIKGIPDGEVLVYQGDVEALEYQNNKVKGSTKGNYVWRHNKGDRVHAKQTNHVEVYRSARNPRLNYLIGRHPLIIKGMYEG